MVEGVVESADLRDHFAAGRIEDRDHAFSVDVDARVPTSGGDETSIGRYGDRVDFAAVARGRDRRAYHAQELAIR